jgi:hypothetical protein
MTSIASTNLLNDEGMNGEMKAGRKKTTEGLTSFFINRGPRGLHTIYQEVIVRYSRFLSLTDQ